MTAFSYSLMSLVPIVAWCVLVLEAIAAAWLQYPWRLTDSAHYLDLARNLSGPGFVSMTSDGFAPEALRSPGYPLFLNLLMHRWSWPIEGVIALQMTLYLASIAITAHAVIQHPVVRSVFLVVAAVYVFPFFYSALLLSEAAAIFLVASVVALLSGAGQTTLLRTAFAGCLAGVATLVRADLLPTIAALLCVLSWRFRSQLRLAVLHCTVGGISAAILLLPYMIWNHQKLGEFRPVPVASALGQSLYLATWESSLQLPDRQVIVGGTATPAAIESGVTSELEEIVSRAAVSAPSVGAADDYPARQWEIATGRAYLDAALRRIRQEPADAVLHSVNGTWRLVNTAEYPPLPALLVLLLKVISYGVFALGVAGAGIAVASSGLISRTPIVFWLAVHVPHLPLHTEARYTASIRLVMMFYASVAIVALLRMRLDPQARSKKLARSRAAPAS